MEHHEKYTLLIHNENDGMLWGEVRELPGCFASGEDMDELMEAANEAISMYLREEQQPSNVVEFRKRQEPNREASFHAVPTELVLEG